MQEKPGRHASAGVFSEKSALRMSMFSYEANGERRREILRDINLEVKAGEILAVVGSSGAGKSTLVHLIPRFFDVTSGGMSD